MQGYDKSTFLGLSNLVSVAAYFMMRMTMFVSLIKLYLPKLISL